MKHSYLVLTWLCALLAAGQAFAQADQILPPVGGPGGGRFEARCADLEILNGFELRTGDDVDAIRPICATAIAPNAISQRRPYATSFGGNGGTVVQLLCPDHAPAIAGIHIWSEGKSEIVNTIRLFCSVATPNQPLTYYPSAVFDGQLYGSRYAADWEPRQQCPAGLVPVGITGRSGIWLDAFGLVCGRLQFAQPPRTETITSLGRTVTPSPPQPGRHICDAARDARARNSPAAPRLEAQCRAAPPAPPPPTPAPGAGTTAAAPPDFYALAARGAELSLADPLANELRNRIAERPLRLGFDVGMGIWEGNTQPGPNKQRVRDALAAAEQPGFDLAAAFSLPRNKHAALASVGAAIGNADQDVATARNAENDVFFWLGFDIASGIFGARSAGAQGNTATGPGSLGIRNDLNAQGQRGFNAATALHLGRRYQ